ncbi:hypothetical protein GJV80_18135 [Microlunatus sp. Gsoil 973]|nr:hypothetical protein GJV80_18135 [Microlunatus sp. Gsoil 973]
MLLRSRAPEPPLRRRGWIFDGTTFWTYDDPAEIATQGRNANARGLGGVMTWSMDGATPRRENSSPVGTRGCTTVLGDAETGQAGGNSRIGLRRSRNAGAVAFPVAAGEIGKLDRCIAVGDRLLAQRTGGRPRGGVVDVHVRNGSGAHRLDQSQQDEVVHASVTAAGHRLVALLSP